MKVLSSSPEETFRFGILTGRLLKKGDVVCLFGELGSGKTIFVKGMASTLGIPERDIMSASFTIIAEHDASLRGVPILFFHIDLYRIGGPEELDSLGVEEYIGKDGIAVIEWADRMEMIEGSISVSFTILDDDRRELAIEGVDEADWDHL